MDNLQILPTDLVLVRLTCRARDAAAPVELDEAVRVSSLNYNPEQVGGQQGGPQLTPEFSAMLASEDPQVREQAIRELARFNDEVADFMAEGGQPPAELLAESVVDWVIETRPGGHQYTKDVNAREGYIVSPSEVNINGPQEVGEDRIWRVTAVGTWG